ncbi:MAG: hypothetical protein ABIN18_24590 [Pseudomonadota bacterium]
MMSARFTHCYIDESIHDSVGVVVTAFIFTDGTFSDAVTEALQKAGLNPPQDEFKSSTRMDTNEKMRKGRENLLALAGRKSKIAVFFGPFHRPHLGRQTFQALQSVLIRNAIQPESLSVYFDEEIFPSQKEADRLHALFHSLKGCKIFACEDSRICVGIQVADAVAHSFGRIIKEALTDTTKMIDIGGPDTGYSEGTEAPLGWSLLMNLRYALLTRPVVYNGEPYPAASDPVVIDPVRDDPVDFGIHPILLGWGVQVAPEADTELRQAVDKELGRLWLGCIH